MKASAAIGSGTSRRGPLAGGKSLGSGKYNLRFDSEKTGKKFMQKHGFKEDVDEAYGKVMSSYGKVMSAYGKDDHTMDPKSHVKKDSDGMFVVYHKNGKAVKKFEDKKEADAYAIKNHDDLMKENMMLAPMGKGRKAVKAMYSKEAYHSKKKKMEAMDKVGQEDGDIDNDGDMDSSDKYLMKRRKAIGKAMKSKSNKSNEGMGAY